MVLSRVSNLQPLLSRIPLLTTKRCILCTTSPPFKVGPIESFPHASQVRWVSKKNDQPNQSTKNSTQTQRSAPNKYSAQNQWQYDASYEDVMKMAKGLQRSQTRRQRKDKDVLVYEAGANRYLWGATATFYGTAAVSLVYLPFNVWKIWSSEIPLSSPDFNITLIVSVLINLFVIFQPLIFRQYTKRYVIRSYFNEATDTFTFIMQSPFLFLEKVKIKSGEAEPAGKSIFTNWCTTFYSNGKPYLMISDRFIVPYYYNRLFGYDTY
ncbi:transmembrane protein 70, mitochondrial-like [Glandiceps talaboti]